MLRLNNVNKFFNKGKNNEIHVIDNTTLNIGNTGLVALLGPSGCGKTTLLNVIGGLDKIKSGSIYIDNEKITSRSSYKIDKIRTLNVGYIFQDYKLLDNLTVYENIAISLRTIGIKDKNEINKRIDYILEKVYMSRYKNRPCSMLSGGERQRIGIARALVKNPNIILADEPTGNLDSKNSLEIMKIIKAISKERLVILVTHEEGLAKFFASRIIEIRDGKIIADYENQNDNSLNYQLENVFYLKDFKNIDKVSNNNKNINIYSDKDENINIDLVFKNGNIYIRNHNNERVLVVDDKSSVELLDEHYREYTKEESLNYQFNFNDMMDKNYRMHYASIYHFFNFIKSGFEKIFNYSILKKILLLGFFLSSIMIMVSYSSIFSSFNIKDSSFVTVNKNYVVINKVNSTVSDYEKISNISSIQYVLPGDSLVNFCLVNDDYYQTSIQNNVVRASIAPLNIVSDNDILYGRNVSDKDEVLLDMQAIDSFLRNDESIKMLGLKQYQDFLDKELLLNTSLKFKIVGIVSLDNPSLYVDSSLFTNIIANSVSYNQYVEESYNNFLDYNLYKDKIKVVKGRLPLNDYEVIVNNNESFEYPLNKQINIKINDKKLKVVGYYETKENINYYFVNEKMILYRNILKNNGFSIFTDNKKEVIEEAVSYNYNAVDSYQKSKNEYITSKKETIKATVASAIVILIISLVEIYLMMRSSFLSRIKEVGILRAIGVKKSDIYKMFTGEILAITILASIPGILFIAYILKKLSTISFFVGRYCINYLSVGSAIITVFIFNILVGLLPVYKTIKKRPSEILSRTDID